MNIHLMTWGSVFALGLTLAFAEKLPVPSATTLPKEIQTQGAPLKTALTPVTPLASGSIDNDIPTTQFLEIAQQPLREAAASTRSAKDAEIYRTLSPSVVEVRTKDGLGSGSLVSTSGEILTNWHVINGSTLVAVVFKPAIEGMKPGPDDMKLGRVVKYDQVG